MGGENLLAQRGAGARHADDEHRRRIGVVGARAGRQAGAVKQRDIGVDEAAMRRRAKTAGSGAADAWPRLPVT